MEGTGVGAVATGDHRRPTAQPNLHNDRKSVVDALANTNADSIGDGDGDDVTNSKRLPYSDAIAHRVSVGHVVL